MTPQGLATRVGDCSASCNADSTFLELGYADQLGTNS